MKKYLYLFVGIICTLLACGKSDKVCDVDDPATELTWLADLISNYSKDKDIDQKISWYEYKGENVFYIEDCLNCSDALAVIRDCDQNVLCEFGGIDGRNTCPDFTSLGVLKEIIYTDLE